MLKTILFAAATVFPIFSLIVIGVFLRRNGTIGKDFITSGSNVVFKLALPAMIFSKMLKLDHIPDTMPGALLLFAAVTVAVYIAVWIVSSRLPVPVHGGFVQGAFRGNISIIGIAVAENAFGLGALQNVVVTLMVMMPMYNILAIIVLGRSSLDTEKGALRHVVFNIIKNPIIWAIALGLPLGLLHIKLPGIITMTFDYLSRLAMPLALISIGGSLTFTGLVKRKGLWMAAAAIKLLVIPLLVWIGAVIFNITGDARSALIVAAACPTAVSSFAMAQAMGADSELSGEIVSATTLLSVITITFWIVLLMH